MGLMDLAAGAAAGGGAALEKVGYKLIDEEIQRSRDERLEEIRKAAADVAHERTRTLAEEQDTRRHGQALELAGRQSELQIEAHKKRAEFDLSPTQTEGRAAQARAVGRATEEGRTEGLLANADRVRTSKVKDLEAENTAKAKSFVDNWNDPNYQRAARAKILAEHPPESSATQAQARLAQFQLTQAQELGKLHTDLANAKDPAEKKQLQDRISALGYTGKWTNMAPLLTAGTKLMDEATRELDPAMKATLQAQAAVFFKMAGVGEDTPAAGRTGRDTVTGDVFKDGKKIGNAATAEEARAMILRGGPATARTRPHTRDELTPDDLGEYYRQLERNAKVKGILQGTR